MRSPSIQTAFTGQAGELRASASGANTLVSGDINGDRQTDFQVLLTGAHSLTNQDFLL